MSRHSSISQRLLTAMWVRPATARGRCDNHVLSLHNLELSVARLQLRSEDGTVNGTREAGCITKHGEAIY